MALILCAIPSLLAAAACLLPFLVLGAIFSVVKTPEEKDRKRQLKELEQQGRVLDWQEARARVVAGSGTFMVDGDPWRIRYLWWIHLSRDALDPAGSFESWNGNFRTLLIGCSSRRDLERVIHGAFFVRQHRPHYAAIPDQLVRLPTIEIDRSLLKVALTGEVTDPISWPTGDPTSDAIRAERDRLLDLRDQAVNQAEYEQLTEIDRQVKALEQQFLAMTGAAPVERRDTMQSRLHMFALPLFDVVLCSNDAGGRPSKSGRPDDRIGAERVAADREDRSKPRATGPAPFQSRDGGANPWNVRKVGWRSRGAAESNRPGRKTVWPAHIVRIASRRRRTDARDAFHLTGRHGRGAPANQGRPVDAGRGGPA